MFPVFFAQEQPFFKVLYQHNVMVPQYGAQKGRLKPCLCESSLCFNVIHKKVLIANYLTTGIMAMTGDLFDSPVSERIPRSTCAIILQ